MTGNATHGGPLHAVRTKAELARHVGEDHEVQGVNSLAVLRVAYPVAGVRARWSRQELEQTHATMHDGMPS